MTHTELKTILKEYRDMGYTLEVKLNATTEKLQAEYDRIQVNLLICPELETSCELTCDVNLLEIKDDSFAPNDLPKLDFEEMHPDDYELMIKQYCEMVGVDIADFKSVENAREFLDAFAPWTREGEPVRETFHTPTLVDEFVTEIKLKDTYWIGWNAAYSSAMQKLANPIYGEAYQEFSEKWQAKISAKPTKQPQFGVIAIALLLAFAEIFKKAVDKAIDSMTFKELAQFFIELRKSVLKPSRVHA